MTITTVREQLDDGSPGGCRVRGLARQVIQGVGAARSLLVGESGALVLIDQGTAQTYTLPAITAQDIGMYFEFLTTVIGTSAYTVITDAATTFMVGALVGASFTLDLSDLFLADGTTVRIDLDAATTGEEVGSQFTLTALSTTLWGVGGYISNTGQPATPFA